MGRHESNVCEPADLSEMRDLAEINVRLAAESTETAFQLQKLQIAAFIYQQLGEKENMIDALEHAATIVER